MLGTLASDAKFNYELLYKNDLVDNIYEACSCCYDNTKSIPYLEKKKYIGKRVNSGHESILEHGKLAILFTNISTTLRDVLIELMGLDYTKWLEFYTVELENYKFNLIINGSIRAYKYLLNKVTEDDYDRNDLIRAIIRVLSDNTVKELYGKDIMFTDFVDVEPDYNYELDEVRNGIQYKHTFDEVVTDITTNSEPDAKQVTLGIDIESDNDVLNKIIDAGFSTEVYNHIIPVSVVFRNMSRTATHQLVRHRNAITQESQRYVTAKNASFTIPIDGYTDEKEYTVDIFGKKSTVPLTVLATQLTKVYDQLIKQGLKKEEARAFLPSNINCGRLYMTFTLYTLFAFLNLRTDSHAQFEIRRYAETIKTIIDSHLSSSTDN